jgi:hypothetical protein
VGRRILASVLGILAAGVVVAAVEAGGHRAFPPPAGFDPQQPDLSLLGVEHFAAVGLAWALGALVAGLVAALVAPTHARRGALVAGGMLVVLDLLNLLAIPSPWFLWLVGIGAPVPAALLGARLVKGSPAAP